MTEGQGMVRSQGKGVPLELLLFPAKRCLLHLFLLERVGRTHLANLGFTLLLDRELHCCVCQ